MQIIIMRYDPREMLSGSTPQVHRIVKELAEAEHGQVILTPPGIWFEELRIDGDEIDVVALQEEGKEMVIIKKPEATKKITRRKRAAVEGDDSVS